MAIYIKGDKVDNATHYTLLTYNATSGQYTEIVTYASQDGINFNLTALKNEKKLEEKEYTFVVQARAKDYEASAYSNQIVCNLATGNFGTSYIITYFYKCNGTAIADSTQESVTEGAPKTFSVDFAPDIDGYTCVSVSPSGTLTINENTTVTYTYDAVEVSEPDEPDDPESGGGTTGSPIWYITSLNDVAATGKDVTGGTVFTGSSIAPVALDETFNAKLVGKTIDMIEFVPEKAGIIHFGVYNTTTYAYTSKASITIDAADLNTRKTYTFTPFAINTGEAFTYYQSGDVGCMSYYLSKDVPGVEYCNGLRTKCNGAAPTAFNHDIITLFNVGNSSAGSGGGGSSGGETPAGTTWYIQSLQQLQDSGNDIAANKVKLQSGGSSYSWAFNQLNAKLEGKTINTIELMPCAAGSFSVGVFNPSTNTVSNKKTFTVAETDIDTIKTYYFEDLTIPTGQYFVWNCSGVSSGEAVGYYILKAKLDPLAVETSNWYQAKSTGLVAFGTHELVFVANIGYTAS